LEDRITKAITAVLDSSAEPLETKEVHSLVQKKIGSITRTMLFYRLNVLRGDGKVKGKFVGPGKGVWIWWSVKWRR